MVKKYSPAGAMLLRGYVHSEYFDRVEIVSASIDCLDIVAVSVNHHNTRIRAISASETRSGNKRLLSVLHGMFDQILIHFVR